jgi:AraC-like DNA-binding protein
VIDGYGQVNYSGSRLTIVANGQPVRVANCYQPDCDFDYVSLFVKPEFLVDQIGVEAEHLPDTIQAILRGTEGGYFNQSLSMTPNMMSALEDLTTSHYSGKLQETFARIKTMELLFLAVQALTTSSNSTQTKMILGDYHIDLLHQARDILDDEYAAPPTLAELGRQVGMNRNKLSQGFKLLFGSGVYEYCQQLRMQQSMLLLKENRLSLLQIADCIGYKNQSSFTRAYKNFYGHLPSLEQ